MKQNKYLSRYSNNKEVSAAQYITEIICEHLAKKDKKDLHYKFWTNPIWTKFYKSQIFSAHKLLKQYSAKAIIAALQTPKGVYIYSLRAPHLIQIIEEQQKIINIKKEQDNNNTTKIIRHNNSFGKIPIKKTNILDKLKELDNEH
jgi:methionine salvage enolase-phosphatase E1